MSNEGNSPLIWAVDESNFAVIDCLVTEGADVKQCLQNVDGPDANRLEEKILNRFANIGLPKPDMDDAGNLVDNGQCAVRLLPRQTHVKCFSC